ncbi:MAG: hypothetical protein GXY85_10920 [Candidatus Brocadiaceae bacterium]|nr:hypothetical protein [Candidatus Brocadiaceae bacterium]
MRRSRVHRIVLVVAVAALLVAAPGCLLNSANQPQITVQFGSGRMLHIAALPQLLPDGTSSAPQRDALLAELAGLAGGYTLIPDVMGGWVPPGQTGVLQEVNDLLLLVGPPEAAYLLHTRLREDFQQEAPFVQSLPIQAIALVYPSRMPPTGPGEAELPAPAEAAMTGAAD